MQGQGRRFEPVHALRGVAALSVLLYHALFKSYLAQRPGSLLAPWAAHLDVGVPIFFVISGFVLYRPMAAARLAGEPPIDVERYGRRRIRRIVPAYWAALVIAGLAGASYFGYAGIFSPKGALAYFGFLQIYSPDTAGGGISVAWTLCVELTFYAFLPLWAAAVRRGARRATARSEYVALAGLFAASVAWQLVAVHATNVNMFGLSAARWIEPLPNFLDQFAVGMALAVASAARAGRPLGRPAWAGWPLAALAFAALATLIGAHALTPGTYLLRHQLNTIVALGVVAPAVFAAPRALRVPGLAFLGTISYGIYLYHVPVMVRMAKWSLLPRGPGSLALWLGGAVVCTVALATASWYVVERPLLRGRQRPTTSDRPVLPASSTARREMRVPVAGTEIA